MQNQSKCQLIILSFKLKPLCSQSGYISLGYQQKFLWSTDSKLKIACYQNWSKNDAKLKTVAKIFKQN